MYSQDVIQSLHSVVEVKNSMKYMKVYLEVTKAFDDQIQIEISEITMQTLKLGL